MYKFESINKNLCFSLINLYSNFFFVLYINILTISLKKIIQIQKVKREKKIVKQLNKKMIKNKKH